MNSLDDPLPRLLPDQSFSGGRPIQRWIVEHQDDAIRRCVHVCHQRPSASGHGPLTRLDAVRSFLDSRPKARESIASVLSEDNRVGIVVRRERRVITANLKEGVVVVPLSSGNIRVFR